MAHSPPDNSSPVALPAWASIQESLTELRHSQESLSAFVGELYGELEQANVDFADREQRLKAEEERLARVERDVASLRESASQSEAAETVDHEQLTAMEAQLQTTCAALAEARAQLDGSERQRRQHAEQLAAQRAELDRLRAQWEQARREREALSAESQSRGRHEAELAGASRDLHAAQSQLADARQELAQLRQQLSAAQHSPEGESHLRKRLAELDDERRCLELELETVRQRAAELSETLGEQRRQIAEDRAQWSTELKQLRRTLERQADSLAQRPQPAVWSPPTEMSAFASGSGDASSAPAGVAVASAAPARSPAVDSVLGDVMAQFERLQQDRLKRRAKRAG